MNQTQSKILRDNDKTDVHVHNKVSIEKSLFCDSDNSMISVNTSEQDCIASTQRLHNCDSVKQGSNNVNTSEHDYVDVTNRFAVLCVGSSEDEDDSLDF